MAVADDMARIAGQEEALVFTHFDEETALALGLRLKAEAEARALPVAIDIHLWHRPLFFFAMPGTTADNPDWIRRKRNTTRRYGRSSYFMMLRHEQRGFGFRPDDNADPGEFTAHGGSFPLRVKGAGIIGAVTVSGAPSRDDHAIVVEALAQQLGIDPAPLRLDPR